MRTKDKRIEKRENELLIKVHKGIINWAEMIILMDKYLNGLGYSQSYLRG